MNTPLVPEARWRICIQYSYFRFVCSNQWDSDFHLGTFDLCCPWIDFPLCNNSWDSYAGFVFWLPRLHSLPCGAPLKLCISITHLLSRYCGFQHGIRSLNVYCRSYLFSPATSRDVSVLQSPFGLMCLPFPLFVPASLFTINVGKFGCLMFL